MGVAFLHDLIASRDVQEPGHLLVNDALPQALGHRHDMLARIVGDEEAGNGAQQLCRLWDVAKLEVSDFSGK